MTKNATNTANIRQATQDGNIGGTNAAGGADTGVATAGTGTGGGGVSGGGSSISSLKAQIRSLSAQYMLSQREEFSMFELHHALLSTLAGFQKHAVAIAESALDKLSLQRSFIKEIRKDARYGAVCLEVHQKSLKHLEVGQSVSYVTNAVKTVFTN